MFMYNTMISTPVPGAQCGQPTGKSLYYNSLILKRCDMICLMSVSGRQRVTCVRLCLTVCIAKDRQRQVGDELLMRASSLGEI